MEMKIPASAIAPVERTDAPAWTSMTDVACANMGGRAVTCNDEFFAEAMNLVSAHDPIFLPDKFTDRGKWMDGWETRRRREPGHDWVIVALGAPATLAGVDVDTAYFVGNCPERVRVLGADVGEGGSDSDAAKLGDHEWTELTPESEVLGGTHNWFAVHESVRQLRVTHLKLEIFPDGGVARLRAYGEVQRDWDAIRASGERVDLAGAVLGGVVLACNDEFFCHKGNLVLPKDAANMGEGWETRRRRGPGCDWIVVRLAHPGEVDELVIDTSHYKGNYPESCEVHAVSLPAGTDPDCSTADGADWHTLLPRTKLSADHKHRFAGDDLVGLETVSHLKLTIHPDGGVARLRAFGRPAGAAQ